jgi:hypothetical protein
MTNVNNYIAFAAVTGCSIASAGAIMGAVGCASTAPVTAVALGSIGLISAGFATGAGTAWMLSNGSDTPAEYLESAQKHAAVIIAGSCNGLAHILINTIVKTAITAISDNLYDRIRGRNPKDTATIRVR